jgi:alpha-L-rhamnosidase
MGGSFVSSPVSRKLIFLLTFLAVSSLMRASDLAASFAQPPDDARPWVFWHWINGNVSKPGITKDLEAMRAQGIGGVLIVDLKGDGSFIPEGPIKFGTPEYWDCLKFAISEADRLGLKVRMNPGTGWSAGGPWITPGLSMQHVVSTSLDVTGPLAFDAVLPQPITRKNYYRDIAVLAFPSLRGEGEGISGAAARITSNAAGIDVAGLPGGKGNLVGLPRPTADHPIWLQLLFDQPYPARSFTLETGVDGCGGALQVSSDGATFHEVRKFSIPINQHTSSFAFTAPPSRFYRVQFTTSSGWEPKLYLGRIELGTRRLIDGLAAKIYESGYNGSHDLAPTDAGDAIDPVTLVNLTGKLRPDGSLAWAVPPGKWTILRVGCTTTGMGNRVPRTGAAGLECDKLSTAATDTQWNGFTAKLLQKIGPLAGRTFLGTFIDSYETDYQNWTPAFAAEFAKRRGYDMTPYLPAITGRFVGDADRTDCFLADFRKTIEELFAENYAGEFARLNHAKGLDFALEPYGGGPMDVYTYGKSADLPMEEFWFEDVGSDLVPSIAASLAHLQGKNIAGAEAFTGRETSQWRATPSFLKKLGDVEFARGINQFTIHSYAHQPWPNAAPGMTFDSWGTRFERTTTWWDQSGDWLRYIARASFLLRQGLPVVDVVGLSRQTWPKGYAFDGCDEDAVLHRMSVQDGQILLPDGMRYRLLTLSGDGSPITLPLLRKVGELVKAGATVAGRRPVRAPSLEGYPQADVEFQSLVAQIWGDCDGNAVKQHAYGQGRVVSGLPLVQVLHDRGVEADFAQQLDDGTQPLRYYHRRAGETDIYFVCNPTDAAVNAHITLRASGRRPEWWDANTGRIDHPALFADNGTTTELPVHLDPRGSVFVIFREKSPDSPVVSVTDSNGAIIVSAAQKPTAPSPREALPPVTLNRDAHGTLVATIRDTAQAGTTVAATADGQHYSFRVEPPPLAREITGPWSVTFPPHLGAPDKINLDRLTAWNDSPDSGIRYFSGTATYRKTIKISAAELASGLQIFLDLGEVHEIAQVLVNGHDTKILWKAPFTVEITPALKPGPNELEISITNLWPNRMIGDEYLPPGPEWTGNVLHAIPSFVLNGLPDPTGRITFSTYRPLTTTTPLLPSGLLGPARLTFVRQVALR